MIPTDNAATACFLIPNFGQFCHANCCLNMEYIKLVEMFIDKYKDKKKCAPVNMPPKPRPEYSNPQFRKNHVYKPAGLSGKAGEVLGVTNKPMYKGNKNKPLPKVPKKAPKMKKPAVKNATKPLPPLPGKRKPKKKSTGCVVM